MKTMKIRRIMFMMLAAFSLASPSRWDRYLGMTAVMTQVLSPRLAGHSVTLWLGMTKLL